MYCWCACNTMWLHKIKILNICPSHFIAVCYNIEFKFLETHALEQHCSVTCQKTCVRSWFIFRSTQLTEKFVHRGLLNMLIRIAVQDTSSILTYLYTCGGESPYGGIPCWPIKGSFVSTCITPALWITHTPSNTDIVVGSILWFGRHTLFNFDYWAPLMLIWILCMQ